MLVHGWGKQHETEWEQAFRRRIHLPAYVRPNSRELADRALADGASRRGDARWKWRRLLDYTTAVTPDGATGYTCSVASSLPPRLAPITDKCSVRAPPPPLRSLLPLPPARAHSHRCAPICWGGCHPWLVSLHFVIKARRSRFRLSAASPILNLMVEGLIWRLSRRADSSIANLCWPRLSACTSLSGWCPASPDRNFTNYLMLDYKINTFI